MWYTESYFIIPLIITQMIFAAALTISKLTKVFEVRYCSFCKKEVRKIEKRYGKIKKKI